jgi:ADP-dependent NAD(P)H-hydrate dehydratase / NAD(P)H-hydrate epimerase
MNDANPILFTTQIREIERLAAAQPDAPSLMEKAGLAAAQIARDKLLTHEQCNVLMLAGPGNNGGDAFVVARYLKQWGHAITLVFAGDQERLPDDAKNALQQWLAVDGNLQNDLPDRQNWDLIIDGLFGIGLNPQRPLQGQYLDWVHAVNRMNSPVLALDIPSGLGSDNGCIYGAVINATITVTFIGLKPGLLTNFGPEYCGDILLSDLDLDTCHFQSAHAWVLNAKLAQTLLPPPRPANSHKGTFGSIGILGGSHSMVGAALLAGRAALNLGAGRVYLGLIARNAPAVDDTQPELMLRSPHELFKLKQMNCLVAGPGLGMNSDAYSWLNSALTTQHALILDADALNHIAVDTQMANKLRQRAEPAVLTPHPAEAARLLNIDVAAVQNDRLGAAQRIAEDFNCHVVLKGAGSICTSPNSTHYINTSGNPGLSSAGTGDVLSGMIGALISQGLSPQHALLLAVYLHGAAADELRQQHHGPLGMTASEIIPAARGLLNQWIYNS